VALIDREGVDVVIAKCNTLAMEYAEFLRRFYECYDGRDEDVLESPDEESNVSVLAALLYDVVKVAHRTPPAELRSFLNAHVPIAYLGPIYHLIQRLPLTAFRSLCHFYEPDLEDDCDDEYSQERTKYYLMVLFGGDPTTAREQLEGRIILNPGGGNQGLCLEDVMFAVDSEDALYYFEGLMSCCPLQDVNAESVYYELNRGRPQMLDALPSIEFVKKHYITLRPLFE
jgi:hypothetical protein